MSDSKELHFSRAIKTDDPPVAHGSRYQTSLVAQGLDSLHSRAPFTAIITTNSQGGIAHLNRVAEQLLQQPVARVLGRAVVDVLGIQEDDRPWFSVASSSEKLNLADDSRENFSCTVHHATGESQLVSWSRLDLRDASDKVEAVIFTGVFPQPRDGASLGNDTPWCFLEDGHQAMAIANSAGTVLSVNRSLIDLWGFQSDSEIVGQRFSQLLKELPYEDLTQQRARAELTSGRHIAVAKDGTEFLVETATLGMKTADNELTFMLLFKNVNEVLQFEKEVRAYADRLQAILNSSPECVKIVDKECRLLEMNPAGLAMIEAESFQAVENANVLQLVEPESHAVFLEGLSNACAGRRTLLEFGIIGLQGTPRWMEQHAVGVKGLKEDPDEMCMLAVTRDITEQKKAQKQLGDLRDKLANFARLGTLGELASGLSHELNQPLAALELYANAALELNEESQSEMRADCLRQVSQQTLLAGEIVKRMRSFVKGAPPRPERVQLNDLVTEVLKICEADLKSSSVAVKTDLQADLPEISLDKIQIQQVLINLIRNAMEAMGNQPVESRLLGVETRVQHDRIRLRVIDSGEGIGSELAPKLFLPFQSSKAEGLGLGLSISQNVIEAHGGRIKAVANAEIGTTFEFDLPLVVTGPDDGDAELQI